MTEQATRDAVKRARGRASAMRIAKAAREELRKRPVAWRVQLTSGEWILYQNEEAAYRFADADHRPMQGLYIRDGVPSSDITDEMVEAAAIALGKCPEECPGNCSCRAAARRAIEAALTAAVPPADRIDAERWRALMASARLHYMSSAGIEIKQKDPNGDRGTTNLQPVPRLCEVWHFGMEFWSQHRAAGNPLFPDGFERELMVAYTDAMRALLKP